MKEVVVDSVKFRFVILLTKCKKCISDLSIFGFCIVYDMPRNFLSLPELIQHIGIEKSTHYGKSFKVVSKADPSNAAYTTLPLGLHLDMPIYHYKPGVRNVKRFYRLICITI